jgi:hypothetical protein
MEATSPKADWLPSDLPDWPVLLGTRVGPVGGEAGPSIDAVTASMSIPPWMRPGPNSSDHEAPRQHRCPSATGTSNRLADRGAPPRRCDSVIGSYVYQYEGTTCNPHGGTFRQVVPRRTILFDCSHLHSSDRIDWVGGSTVASGQPQSEPSLHTKGGPETFDGLRSPRFVNGWYHAVIAASPRMALGCSPAAPGATCHWSPSRPCRCRLATPVAPAIDKGKPGVSRGRKATGLGAAHPSS